jgi:hypothetical protein
VKQSGGISNREKVMDELHPGLEILREKVVNTKTRRQIVSDLCDQPASLVNTIETLTRYGYGPIVSTDEASKIHDWILTI